MIDRLQKLLAAREARLRARQVELTAVLATLRAVEQEIAALDEEQQQIETQRAAWESCWQSWLREDTLLCHGQEYNLYHVTLTAWETDVAERRDEAETRRQEADAEVSAARELMLKAQRRVDVVKRELRRLIDAQRTRRANAVDARVLEELSFHDRATRHSA